MVHSEQRVAEGDETPDSPVMPPNELDDVIPESPHAAYYRAELARRRAMTPEEIAADLAAMAEDPEREAEAEQLDREFDQASWEALLEAEREYHGDETLGSQP